MFIWVIYYKNVPFRITKNMSLMHNLQNRPASYSFPRSMFFLFKITLIKISYILFELRFDKMWVSSTTVNVIGKYYCRRTLKLEKLGMELSLIKYFNLSTIFQRAISHINMCWRNWPLLYIIIWKHFISAYTLCSNRKCYASFTFQHY